MKVKSDETSHSSSPSSRTNVPVQVHANSRTYKLLQCSKLTEKHQNCKGSTCLALVKPFSSQKAILLQLLEKNARRMDRSPSWTTTIFKRPQTCERSLLKLAPSAVPVIGQTPPCDKTGQSEAETHFLVRISLHIKVISLYSIKIEMLKSPKLNFFS